MKGVQPPLAYLFPVCHQWINVFLSSCCPPCPFCPIFESLNYSSDHVRPPSSMATCIRLCRVASFLHFLLNSKFSIVLFWLYLLANLRLVLTTDFHGYSHVRNIFCPDIYSLHMQIFMQNSSHKLYPVVKTILNTVEHCSNMPGCYSKRKGLFQITCIKILEIGYKVITLL